MCASAERFYVRTDVYDGSLTASSRRPRRCVSAPARQGRHGADGRRERGYARFSRSSIAPSSKAPPSPAVAAVLRSRGPDGSTAHGPARRHCRHRRSCTRRARTGRATRACGQFDQAMRLADVPDFGSGPTSLNGLVESSPRPRDSESGIVGSTHHCLTTMRVRSAVAGLGTVRSNSAPRVWIGFATPRSSWSTRPAGAEDFWCVPIRRRGVLSGARRPADRSNPIPTQSRGTRWTSVLPAEFEERISRCERPGNDPASGIGGVEDPDPHGVVLPSCASSSGWLIGWRSVARQPVMPSGVWTRR